MFGAILKATNSSFQEGMTFCRSINVKKVMKLLAFIFEQPSYLKMIYFYSPLGIWHVFLYSINTNIYHFRSMKYQQYA